jgi:hypothetical protein
VQRDSGAAVEDDGDLHGSARGKVDCMKIPEVALVHSPHDAYLTSMPLARYARGRPAKGPLFERRSQAGASESCKSPSTPTR